jgi:ketosteroid isomerase-like protein
MFTHLQAVRGFAKLAGMKESQNIETVRSMYTALLRGDISGVLQQMDESIVFQMPGSGAIPTSGTRRGLREVERFFEDLRSLVEFTVFEIREFIAQGNRVVALLHYEGRYKPTGKGFASDAAALWTIGNGRAIRFQEFTDTETLARAARAGGQHSFGAA